MPNYMLLAVLLLFRDTTSQSYPHSRRERVILVQYLPPEINQNEKNTFIHETTFSGPKLCAPLCIYLVSWLGGWGACMTPNVILTKSDPKKHRLVH